MANGWNCDDDIEISAYDYNENSQRYQRYWTSGATKTLISLRGNRESEFKQFGKTSKVGNAGKNKLWENISREMRSLGYNFAPRKVYKKWHNMLMTYNMNLSKKQHSEHVCWEFFNDMDAVFKNHALEIESSSSYQENSSPVSLPTAPKRRMSAEISSVEIEELNDGVSSEANQICWKDYFEQKLELQKEKLKKEDEGHKNNINLMKMALIQDKLKVEAINSFTSAIIEYTRLAEVKQ